MTVKELTETLRNYPDDMEVCYEDDYFNPCKVNCVESRDYCGEEILMLSEE